MNKFIISTAIFLSFTLSQPVLAHPGRTDSYGCHTCRTNCGKWGLSTGEYHCHNAKALPQPEEPIKSHYSETGGYTEPAPEYKAPVIPKPAVTTKSTSQGMVAGESVTNLDNTESVDTPDDTQKEIQNIQSNKTLNTDEIPKTQTEFVSVQENTTPTETDTDGAFFGMIILSGIGYGIYRFVKFLKK